MGERFPAGEAGSEERRIRILAIPGSLRRASYNRKLLEAAKRLARAAVEVDIYDDGLRIPLFNEDSEGDLTPQPVLELRARIRSADAVLIASPEYNGSITGVLKNLIDWASRPYGRSAFEGKPVSVVGGSPSRFGAQRSQQTAIAVLGSAGARVVGGPHPVKNVFSLVDPDGCLSDRATLEMLQSVLDELAAVAGASTEGGS
ncbi:MAG: NAD(P)H-dependent oxidoreductase [bacterium]|nr:NAD(P)H-dependent oxidoreductase [bacterium]MDE0288834.1 NAD(P)H-dependent oxidoreductase [bacterium]MDE0438580.1 NAD(P)H-dependent oxidoreductase [bacterium]